MTDEHLIIFVKNPVPGTVKTRLAQTVGHEQATAIYRQLLQHTQQLVKVGPWHRSVYYGDFVNPDDGWNGYDKRLQTGDNLGQRMSQAFEECFRAGATRVVIIGSDCLDITTDHINQAFQALRVHDVVLGPATDGGYYLLGLTQPLRFLFENKSWSQPTLFTETTAELQQKVMSYTLLEELSDIDEWEDYKRYLDKH